MEEREGKERERWGKELEGEREGKDGGRKYVPLFSAERQTDS